MKARLRRLGRLVAYPAFYLFCLGLFAYLTFPFAALEQRLVAEFDRSQRKERRSLRKEPMQLDLGQLDGYWLTGLEVRGAKLTFPPERKPSGTSALGKGVLPGATAASTAEPSAAEPSVVAVDHAHARVRLFPLLLGRVRIDFGADVFGGKVTGTLPYGGGSGAVEVQIDRVQLAEVEPLRALVGLPLFGIVNGELELLPTEGKFGKADGKLELRIGRLVIGDGKATLQGIALPAAEIGDLVLTGTAKEGLLRIEEISTSGKDLDLQGEGRIRIREPWLRSQADIYLRFRFSDGYRNKDDTTRSALGAPGSKLPPAIEFNPKMKQSKREDGFYAWHIHGPLGDLKFDPQSPQAKGSRTRPSTAAARPPTGRAVSPAAGARIRHGSGTGAADAPLARPPRAADLSSPEPVDSMPIGPEHAPEPEPPMPEPVAGPEPDESGTEGPHEPTEPPVD